MMPANNFAWMTLLIVLLVAITVLAVGWRHLETQGAALLGAAIGVGLALYGLRHTTMERTAAGVFYTGHPYIGLAVTLLLTVRVGYRLLQAGPATAQASGGAALAATFGNPLTAGAFFVAAAYYLVTYGGLLRRRRAVPAATE